MSDNSPPSAPMPPLELTSVPLLASPEVRPLPHFDRFPEIGVREARLLTQPPWVRPIGRLTMEVSTHSWRFPPPTDAVMPPRSQLARSAEVAVPAGRPKTRVRPPSDAVQFKDRLLYLLQPPLEDLFNGRQVHLPFPPYPYQVQGIAFLMPRHAALLADEMGLGKTAQVIIALRLLLHAGAIQRALVVCPKPLVINWTRELRTWAEDVPFEIVAGDTGTREAAWFASRCPIKLVNYELLTRDVDLVCDDRLRFDVVVLDEAQRIKNREAKASQAVRRIRRDRSWAMTGTPIENRTDDLVNIFAFLDPNRIPPETPPRMLPQYTSDCILRRVKEEVVQDMPPKVIQDVVLELTPAQREAYDLAEKEGIIHLDEMGQQITVQHVFELVLRLKQICNFDPLTGQSAKLEQLVADMAEMADSGRKAIVFSQWVEPLEVIARALAAYEPLLYHGKIAPRERQAILDCFRTEPGKHIILMSYGTGSVGLNLQCANYVFLFDRWWNPAVEDQAINRAHRLGQKAQVYVKRFVTQGTIEERIAAVLERKRQLFNELIAQNGPPPSLGLSEEDIFGLFQLRSRPKRQAA